MAVVVDYHAYAFYVAFLGGFMSEFFQDTEKVRIDFPDGQWIEVKPELSQEDQDYIMKHLIKVQGGEAIIEPGQMPLMERAILDWSFTDGKGKVPINRDTISRLKLKYRNKVLAEVNRLNTEALEFVQKN